MNRNIAVTAFLLLALAVVCGAFGAHSLENKLGPEQLRAFENGVRYQFYHCFGILLAFILSGHQHVRSAWLRRAAYFFIAGIVLFSGSLYFLSTMQLMGLSGASWVGPVTPAGGLCFIVGWIMLAAGISKGEYRI